MGSSRFLLPDDIRDYLCYRVGISDTASMTTALVDAIRSHPDYIRLGDCPLADLAPIIRRGRRIVKANTRRPGWSAERRAEKHRLGAE